MSTHPIVPDENENNSHAAAAVHCVQEPRSVDGDQCTETRAVGAPLALSAAEHFARAAHGCEPLFAPLLHEAVVVLELFINVLLEVPVRCLDLWELMQGCARGVHRGSRACCVAVGLGVGYDALGPRVGLMPCCGDFVVAGRERRGGGGLWCAGAGFIFAVVVEEGGGVVFGVGGAARFVTEEIVVFVLCGGGSHVQWSSLSGSLSLLVCGSWR